jgi:hypothetical protein
MNDQTTLFAIVALVAIVSVVTLATAVFTILRGGGFRASIDKASVTIREGKKTEHFDLAIEDADELRSIAREKSKKGELHAVNH